MTTYFRTLYAMGSAVVLASPIGHLAGMQTAGASTATMTAQSAVASDAKPTTKAVPLPMEKRSSRSGARPTSKPKTAANAKATTASKRRKSQDTVRRVAGALGPQSGDQHLAYRGTGSDLDSLWPPKMAAPLPGSILPAKRIIAFYGTPASTRMGILGEFPPDEMLRKLDQEGAEWNKVDPSHPVQPALHLIAVVAQADAGPDGKYRARLDSARIEKVYGWARSKNAIMFLDVQVGLSTLQQELPALERFLKRPDVHLGIDPEFSMKNGGRPGKKIGTYDATDVNYASRFLRDLVDKHKLPPKVLVVHRFTKKGVTNASQIALDPRVQIVMHMDGFGAPWLKRDSYYSYVKKEPVQFAGWKQFSKSRNDNPSTPREAIVRLWPSPLYIQLQ